MTKPEYSSSVSVRVSSILRVAFCVSVVLLLHVPVSAPAQAQSQEQNRPAPSGGVTLIGIVDMAAVMQSSDVIAVIRRTFDEQNIIFQSEISQEEIALRDEEKQLNAERDSLTEDEFKKRLAAFENRVVGLQRKIQSQRNSFDSAYLEAQGRLEEELRRIISDIAAEKGFSIVLDRNNAVLYDNALDISEEALARLNDRMRDVKITLERKEP